MSLTCENGTLLRAETPEATPYERGYAAGYDLKPGPRFPTPDSSWADRLYARGWSSGVDARREADRQKRASE